MLADPSLAWKLVLAVVLGAAIVFGAYGSAPRRRVPHSDLQRLVLSAIAPLRRRGNRLAETPHDARRARVRRRNRGLRARHCGCRVAPIRRGAATRRRGAQRRAPPPRPDGLPQFDWAAFERAFRTYTDGAIPASRPSASSRPRSAPAARCKPASRPLARDETQPRQVALPAPRRGGPRLGLGPLRSGRARRPTARG